MRPSARRVGLAILVGLAPLAGCTKSVAWDEEVVLNTGDVLLVHRTIPYAIAGAPGNPLDIGWVTRPGATLEFAWKGRHYTFSGHDGPLLLAISPQGTPVLVADAGAGRWDQEHRYACTRPHYVQFVPDAAGSRWSWPPAIEPWLHGLPANLLRNYPTPGAARTRFAAPEVRFANESLGPRPRAEKVIDPQYTTEYCKRKGTSS